jgi:hypothetical protein
MRKWLSAQERKRERELESESDEGEGAGVGEGKGTSAVFARTKASMSSGEDVLAGSCARRNSCAFDSTVPMKLRQEVREWQHLCARHNARNIQRHLQSQSQTRTRSQSELF